MVPREQILFEHLVSPPLFFFKILASSLFQGTQILRQYRTELGLLPRFSWASLPPFCPKLGPPVFFWLHLFETPPLRIHSLPQSFFRSPVTFLSDIQTPFRMTTSHILRVAATKRSLWRFPDSERSSSTSHIRCLLGILHDTFECTPIS